jgi:hypothetical protein
MVETLPVIFRAGKEHGQIWITAVFPTLQGTDDRNTFTIYQHIGQHGAGRYEWYRRTRPARPSEYADLLKELRGIYETPGPGDTPAIRLEVRQRMHASYRRQRS